MATKPKPATEVEPDADAPEPATDQRVDRRARRRSAIDAQRPAE